MTVLIPLVTGPQVAFWLLAPVMVLAALGIILSRKPVHSALCLAVVMISLAVQYAAQDAPFLFVVQIIVYTGAILMLFLFVLMLIGVDAADSLVETIRGQRVWAVVGGIGAAVVEVSYRLSRRVERPVEAGHRPAKAGELEAVLERPEGTRPYVTKRSGTRVPDVRVTPEAGQDGVHGD